jgi:hypothetical protein
VIHVGCIPTEQWVIHQEAQIIQEVQTRIQAHVEDAIIIIQMQ